MRPALLPLTLACFASAAALTGFASGWSGTMNNADLNTRLYLGVCLPFLPAERWIRQSAAEQDGTRPDGPLVLIAKSGGSLRIAACDPQARALGLSSGMALADARALVPELMVANHAPEADAALLVRLADACLRYTPMVEPVVADALLLDLTGCLHFYEDGAAGLVADLERRMAGEGLTVRTALASTPDAALALARFGGRDVRQLPVAALRLDPSVHGALRRAGLKSIGDLAARPRAPLAARFGRQLPVLLARLLGEEDAHITPRRVVAPVRAEARFAEPVAHVDGAMEALGWLLRDAMRQLAERGEGGRRFEWALMRSDGHVARLDVETGEACRATAPVLRLFRERVETLSDPLDPGFGYDAMRLSVPLAEPLDAEQPGLDSPPPVRREWRALLDRLAVRLGPERVRHFAPHASHLPECAQKLLPVGQLQRQGKETEWPFFQAGEPPLRPLTLFHPPQRIEVLAEVPDGPPRRFRWRRQSHDVRRHEGPERIAAEWWYRAHGHVPGKNGPTRDYYRVEDKAGQRFWLFRHGLYGAEKAHPDWYLHGLFG